ncbi:sensor histidine kinase RegB, partial [Cognatishimia sp.]|uniref:sensor histidine kinase RegB n=1 Tax=Cognatishimia sp. TaxID=2211648 RepID=UPI0035151D88
GYFTFPENKLLTETENAALLLFDLLQLCFLLFLTGGLNNPFSILVVGPVTVSAATLSIRMTAILASVTIALAALMTEIYLPLRTASGIILETQQIFLIGNFAGIFIAVLFSSIYSQRVVSEMSTMAEALAATQMALAREQKLTDLGGVVAAAAHELGTPLATIKLTSGELMEELSDQPDLREDAALIRQQADRCRDILRSMGRAGKSDLHMRSLPLLTVIEEAAEPHSDRGKSVIIDEVMSDDVREEEPQVLRRAEIVHGLRNLIQNAVDFSKTEVRIEASWTSETVTVRVIDNGPGFPSHVIGRIGSPMLRRVRSDRDRRSRPGYDGMGLGLFIAKTLLERTGASLHFSNLSYETASHSGAIVEVTWPRKEIEAATGVPFSAENPQIKG